MDIDWRIIGMYEDLASYVNGKIVKMFSRPSLAMAV